ncbi:MAG: hypothetical protein QCI00_01825 [Candidatus Thermoplasmatota archaeon]|nr:hypothetical protein [Candidatus Thermoplasmatota archaeon]
MKNKMENKKSGDIEQVQNFLIGLGFICNSYPSAQHLIYSKDGEIVIIKNKKT